MKSISIKLSSSLDVRLSSAARKAKVGKSEIVRKALESYLGSGSSLQKGSCLDLASDLAGSVEGPGDLSYNKKRLEGYGR
jgi:hypothetical protein